MNKSRVKSLDGVKGISSIIIACFFHLATVKFPYKNGYPLKNIGIMNWVYQHGGLFVELFLMISGFLTFYIYFDRINHRGGGITFVDYVKKRAIRILPLVWISLAFTMIMNIVYSLSHNGKLFHGGWENCSFLDLILNIFGIQYAFARGQTWNYPAWSLTVFFVCWVVSYWIIVYSDGKRERTLSCCVIMIILGISLQTSWNPRMFLFNDSVARGYVAFFVGGILCFLQEHINKNIYGKKIAILSILWLVLIALLHIKFSVSIGVWSAGMSLCVFPQLILLVLNIPFIDNLLSLKPFSFLGKISFEIYLLNYSIEVLVAEINDVLKIDIDFSSPLIWIWYIPLHIGFAFIVSFTIEKKLTQSLKTFIHIE